MHVQNEPREDHHGSAGAGTVPEQRSSTAEDTGIRWERDPADADDRPADATARSGDSDVMTRRDDLTDDSDVMTRPGDLPGERDGEPAAVGVAHASTTEEPPTSTAHRADDEEATHTSLGTDQLVEVPQPGDERQTDTDARADRDTTADLGVRADRGNTADTDARADATTAGYDATADTDARADATTAGYADTAGASGTREPATGGDQGAPAAADSGELMPGGADAPAMDDFWADGQGQHFRDRWREVQLRFVDDPRSAAQEAEALVGEAIDGFTAALAARREELAQWRSHSTDDTEELRVALRRYREFLDRVIAP
jgi:hypothetical protein